MSWFRESWNEQVLRQVRMALARCYSIAFDKRDNVRGAVITAHTFNFVTKLISTFGIGIGECYCYLYSLDWVVQYCKTPK